MKKTKIITVALILGASVLAAQTANKPATVRIKKVQNINGVETVTDTTYTTNDVSSLNAGDGIQVITTEGGKEGKMEKVVIVNGEVINGDGKNAKIIKKGDGGDMDAEIEKALKDAGVDPKTVGAKKMVIINDDEVKDGDHKGEKKMTKIVMIKMDVSDCSEADKKRLNSQLGNADDKLNIEKMNMYPNPNDGKFNLNFTLKDKADAQVTVYDIDGKQVFNEKLPAFSGEYNKPIDISRNSKGVYFVKVEQGKHAQVKKIVLE